jgi:glycosyltransferase involved in cell wall biosynthesis
MKRTSGDRRPRVLVIAADPFGGTTGTGVTLSNLFHGWPKDRLAQVYATEMKPTTTTCDQYYRYAPSNAPVDYYVRRLLSKGNRRIFTEASGIAGVPAVGSRGSWSAVAHRQMRAIADLSPARLPQTLMTWVYEFDPDLVYSLLGSVRTMRMACKVARLCGKPLVPHFMDDWPTTLYASGELAGYARRTVTSSLREVVRQSPQGICISGLMAEEYMLRYEMPFVDFANCVDKANFHDPASTQVEPSNSVDLVYVGGLHLGRWELLKDVAAAAQRASVGGLEARLTVHAPDAHLRQYGHALSGLPFLRLGKSLAKNEVSSVLHGAAVLVHVESYDEDIRQYTRLSLSTKIPQYMAAGKPILGYGPAELASMRHIAAAGAGSIVGTQDSQLLTKHVTDLCRDTELRRRLGANSYDYARRRHEKGEVATSFGSFLGDVALGSASAVRDQ